jgi:hypothetical protein
VLLAGPRGTVARLLQLTGQDRIFSVFPGVGVAAFSAGLAAFGIRLAAASVRESRAGIRSPRPTRRLPTRPQYPSD